MKKLRFITLASDDKTKICHLYWLYARWLDPV
jgi:hypothetical protein